MRLTNTRTKRCAVATREEGTGWHALWRGIFSGDLAGPIGWGLPRRHAL